MNFRSLYDYFFPQQPPAEPDWMDVCLPFVKNWEGCRLIAYWDDYGKVWTIGYGATGPGITKGTRWTQARADHDLAARLSVIGDEVDAAVKFPLSQNQKAALADFCYNEGIGTFLKSSVLTELNAGNPGAAMDRLLLYDKAGGQDLSVLDRRRAAEAHLFDT